MPTAPNTAYEPFRRPATFVQSGAAVPFTSPALAGARVRPSVRDPGKAMELVLPNPAGARGVYVMTWPEAADSCNPTLHDMLLFERIVGLAAISPQAIRRAAQAVAATGAAGYAALEAFWATRLRERDQVQRLRARLLDLLPPGIKPAAVQAEPSIEATIQRLAMALGRPAASIASDVARLVEIYCAIGLGDADEAAPCRAIVAGLQRLRKDLAIWTQSPSGAARQTAELLLASIETTLTLAGRSLDEALSRAADPLSLLRSLGSEMTAKTEMPDLTRPEWLLDGWEQVCLVWRLAGTLGTGRVTLAEMAVIAPILPQEAMDWGGLVDQGDTSQQIRRSVRAYEDWRAGSAVFGLIARNEQIRAIAA